MIAMFKLFYNSIAACQRPVGPLLSNKCMYVYIFLLFSLVFLATCHYIYSVIIMNVLICGK